MFQEFRWFIPIDADNNLENKGREQQNDTRSDRYEDIDQEPEEAKKSELDKSNLNKE